MIKVIFFDAAGTLLHLPRGVGWHYRAVALRHGCSLSEDALNRAFGRIWKEMPVGSVQHSARLDDDKEWWRTLVERVLDSCGASAVAVNRSAYFEELYEEFVRPGVWALFPEAREVLDVLRSHYRLGMISNFDGRLRPILRNLGLGNVFDPMVISSEVGADKPHPWIFQRALSDAAVAPHEALHVGDDPECDWQGASGAGLHVFELDRPRRTLLELPSWLSSQSAS